MISLPAYGSNRRKAQGGRLALADGSLIVNLGTAEVTLGQTEQAALTFNRALGIRERHLPKDDPRIAEVQVLLGALLVDLKRLADARVLLERAVATLPDRSSAVNAEAHFTLARALWELGKERDRARELARIALRAQLARGDQSSAAAIETWLAAHQRRCRSAVVTRPIVRGW